MLPPWAPKSPYRLDNLASTLGVQPKLPKGTSILFDGVFKGDYSLAIVNRQLARALIDRGINLSLHCQEADWEDDDLLNSMPDIRARILSEYPGPGRFDIHLRNTWPPRSDDMVGAINAYVCFAWEETTVPHSIVDGFNTHLALLMVTATFVEDAMRRSGLRIPIYNVGDGVDHILKYANSGLQKSERKRIVHVSSCFPRKGVDVLLSAFFRYFSKTDDVELVIKTFRNPHNTVEQQVADLRQHFPDSADVSILTDSLNEQDLYALIQSSHVLVAPSRGEGFGLPLAEATLLGTSVVTTAFGGQLDFCLPSTSWLVDYKLQPSTSHVAAPDAEWAEPDPASLGKQLRAALHDTRTASRKIKRGQALLLAHFKWSNVADRVMKALSMRFKITQKGLPTSPPLRLLLVSTWDQVCGIASYSSHLFKTSSLRPHLSTVLARETTTADFMMATTSDVIVKRPWSYDSQGIANLLTELAVAPEDVVWFQHHPGFFSDADMNRICDALKRCRFRARAITLHNVRDTVDDQRGAWLSSFEIIFVHTVEDHALLQQRQVHHASVVPHGVLPVVNEHRSPSPIVTFGTFGFLSPHKNVPLLIKAFSTAYEINKNLRLKLLTCVKADPIAWKERAVVAELIERLDLGDVVDVDFRYLEEEEILRRLGDCDILVFPYGGSTESASGAARLALAADRPILSSDSSVLRDLHQCSVLLPHLDRLHLAEALLVVASEPAIAHARDAERRVRSTEWSYEAIANRYLTILSRLSGTGIEQ